MKLAFDVEDGHADACYVLPILVGSGRLSCTLVKSRVPATRWTTSVFGLCALHVRLGVFAAYALHRSCFAS